ncbi:MAG TPA: transcription elongation factor GreB [Alphaproteobacteria bacterium]
MSKAFTKEGDGDDLNDVLDEGLEEEIVINDRNMMTPVGHKALQDEYNFLWKEERPRITEIVSWAAGNGDRSENGDYLYNKKKLREIDRRLRYLTKRLDKPEIVDPKKQQNLEQVFFGATVTYTREDGTEMKVQLVGVDEADLAKGKIFWQTPVGRALMKAKPGDEVTVRETGEVLEIIDVDYVI